jgi:lactate permease
VALGLLLARVPPVRAALAALAAGAAAAAVAFPVGWGRLAAAERDALVTAAEVSTIVLGGLLLAELMARLGAQERLGDWVTRLSADPARRVLLVVLGVTPFAESVTGFGVGVVVAVPLLRQMGFPPGRAALLALLGLLAVPWGALAPGTLVAARLGGVDVDALGVRSALLSLPVFVLVGGAALALGVGLRPAVRRAGELVVVALALWAGILGANALLGTPPAGVLGSLVAVLAVVALVAVRERRAPPRDCGAARAALPYGVLVALLLSARGLVAATGGEEAVWGAVLVSPALALLATCALTPWLLSARGPGETREALRAAVPRWWPVAATTVIFLVLGALMTVTGMSAELARAGAALGEAYVALVPWVGGLGGFLTGSNAGANAMFAAAQADAARTLGRAPLDLVAAQNVGASLLTMASAPRVALALGLAGAVPDPARLLRTVLAVDAVALVALGAAAQIL